MRVVGVQEATESFDCVVPLCMNEAERNGRCSAHNRLQGELDSFWMSGRKEAPVVKQGTPDPRDPFFMECVDQLREFNAIYGRWPLPSDARDFPGDLPPQTKNLPWLGGWQPLWDAVGAGQIPGGRSAEKYRRNNPVEGKPVPPPPAPEDRPVITVELDDDDDDPFGIVEGAVRPEDVEAEPDAPEAGPDAESASGAVQAPGTPEPAECAACGSPFVEWDTAEGWSCAECGRTDMDEIDRATAAACPDGEECVCDGRGLCEEFDQVAVADDVLDPGPQPGQVDSLVEVDPESELPATVEELPGASGDDREADDYQPSGMTVDELRAAHDARPFDARPFLQATIEEAVKQVTSDITEIATRLLDSGDHDGLNVKVFPVPGDSFTAATARLELAALALKAAQEEFGAAFDLWENHPVQQIISANVA